MSVAEAVATFLGSQDLDLLLIASDPEAVGAIDVLNERAERLEEKEAEDNDVLSASHIANLLEAIACACESHTSRSASRATTRTSSLTFVKHVSNLIRALVPNDPLDGIKLRRSVLKVLRLASHFKVLRPEEDEGNDGPRRRPKSGGARTKNDNSDNWAIRRITLILLKWLSQVLFYWLCPITDLQVLYDPLMKLIRDSELRAAACEVLSSLTEREQVTHWRIKQLRDVAVNRRDKTTAAIILLRKFKNLNPKLVPERLPHRSEKTLATDAVLQARFQTKWRNRTPIDAEINAIARSTRLSWGPVQLEEESEDGNLQDSEPRKKRRRMHDVFPSPDPNPLRDDRSDGKKALHLQDCPTAEVAFKSIGKLILPGRSISLLRNGTLFQLVTANEKPARLQMRLSVALYHTLYNEFFSSASEKGPLERKRHILQQIYALEDFLQQGIPVVGRFLAEFLVNWNGQELFHEVVSLLQYIQITEFQELSDCVLSPVFNHFSHTFSASQRLEVLLQIHYLAQHWINVEYGLCRRKSPRVFGASNPDLTSPLEALSGLLNSFLSYSELGLAKAQEAAKCSLSSVPRQELMVYVNEVLTMCLTLSRNLIEKKIPLCLELPPSFVYFALFDSSALYLSRVLEHLTVTKHETMPLCQQFIREQPEHNELSLNNDDLRIAQEQLNSPSLNAVTKDILAVLSRDRRVRGLSTVDRPPAIPPSRELQYLDRGSSLFKQSWYIEEDFVYKNLSVTRHRCFLPHSLAFAERFSRENNISIAEARQEMEDEKSVAFSEYMSYLSESLPRVAEFLETFRSRSTAKQHYAQSQASHKSQGTTATSGIGSMQATRTARTTRSAKR